MANSLGTDILIQAEDPKQAAEFYASALGFIVTETTNDLISVRGAHINLFIERGPRLGPVLEVAVDDLRKAKVELLGKGCEIIKDEPEFPRC